MITLLVDAAAFDAPEVRIEGASYSHLFRARRVAVGTEMRVVDGQGRARWGRVARVDRTSATVALGEPAADREPFFRLELLVPTCRPERASWLVEKATEVGVFAVHFLNTARAPRDFGGGALERLRRVAAAAVEQCHRSRLPEITGPHDWSEIARLTGGGPRWFLDPESDTSFVSVGAALRGRPGGEGGQEVPAEQGGHAGPPLQDSAQGALLVGPEGGLAPAERRELLDAGWVPLGLGERILRLETAAVVGAALILLSPSGIPSPKSKIQN
jgi:16S rRNA (uracil1498-N3)-methyltransferase